MLSKDDANLKSTCDDKTAASHLKQFGGEETQLSC